VFLFLNGVNIDAQDSNQQTPLDVAKIAKQKEVEGEKERKKERKKERRRERNIYKERTFYFVATISIDPENGR
jgi:hypothetical protein